MPSWLVCVFLRRIVLCFRLLYAIVLTSVVYDACVCACVCVLLLLFIGTVQRNWACLTWKSAIEIKSLLLFFIHLQLSCISCMNPLLWVSFVSFLICISSSAQNIHATVALIQNKPTWLLTYFLNQDTVVHCIHVSNNPALTQHLHISARSAASLQHSSLVPAVLFLPLLCVSFGLDVNKLPLESQQTCTYNTAYHFPICTNPFPLPHCL